MSYKDENILNLLGLFLDKKDTRTISKLGESNPKLYEVFSSIGSDRMSEFFNRGTFGILDNIMTLSNEEITFMLKSRVESSSLSIEMDEIREHMIFLLKRKMDKFYSSKMDGYGLKNILDSSIYSVVKESDSNSKTSIILAIEAYKTSLSRLEAPNHKKILIEYIENNLSNLECKLLLEME